MSSRGSAREKRPGRWELKVFVGRDPITKKKDYRYETVAALGQRDANDKLAEFVARTLGDRKPRSGARTVGDLLEAWFAARSHEWSPSNAYQTRTSIDGSLAPLRDIDVRDVDGDLLDLFYRRLREEGGAREKPLAPSTVIRLAGMLKQAFDYGVSKHYGGLRRNPCADARPGRQRRRRIVPPTVEQVQALLAAAAEKDPEFLCFFFLDAETGARRGELAALRLNDFATDAVRIERDLIIGLDTPENRREYEGHCWPAAWSRGKNRTLLIEDREPKTEESIRPLALSPTTMALVLEQVQRLADRARGAFVSYPSDGFLFPATIEGDRPLRPESWTRRWTALRDDLGLKVRLHDLRHFMVTSLLTRGVDVATVAGRAGHGGGGKTTLGIYAAFLKEPDRSASELMEAILRPDPTPPAEVIPMAGRTRRRR